MYTFSRAGRSSKKMERNVPIEKLRGLKHFLCLCISGTRSLCYSTIPTPWRVGNPVVNDLSDWRACMLPLPWSALKNKTTGFREDPLLSSQKTQEFRSRTCESWGGRPWLHVAYWAIQAGLLTPLTFARHRLSPLAAFTSGAYFLHNGRRWQRICEFYTANVKGIFWGT